MEESSEQIRKKIDKLKKKIFTEIEEEKADNLNAVQTVETKQARETQIDLALGVTYN